MHSHMFWLFFHPISLRSFPFSKLPEPVETLQVYFPLYCKSYIEDYASIMALRIGWHHRKPIEADEKIMKSRTKPKPRTWGQVVGAVVLLLEFTIGVIAIL